MSIFEDKIVKYTAAKSNDIKHFQVGYFTEKIDLVTSKYLSTFVFLFKEPEHKIFLHFNLPDIEDLQHIIANTNHWTFLFKYEEEQGKLFFKKKNVYAVGYCEDIEQLTYILKFLWNHCHESFVILVLSKEIDNQSIKEVDGKKLALNYPVVISRGHDGYCVEIFSKELDSKNFANKLKSFNDKYGLTTVCSDYL